MQIGNGFLGMNIEGVNRVAGSIDGEAARISGVVTSLSATLQNTHWVGADRERFVAEWNGTCVPAMRRAVSDMRQASEQVRTSIKLQVQASGR